MLIKIAFGGTSEQKIGYLKEVLEELKIKAEVCPVAVESAIADQPLSSKETKQGSINRAKSALSRTPDADFAIGTEVGYEKNQDNKYEMFCWTTITDKNGVQISSQSHRFLLPKFHQDILRKNLYLSDYVQEYINQNDDPTIKQIGEDIRGRRPFITNSLRHVLLRYLGKKEF